MQDDKEYIPAAGNDEVRLREHSVGSGLLLQVKHYVRFPCRLGAVVCELRREWSCECCARTSGRVSVLRGALVCKAGVSGLL